ncbi:MAG: hypothetical protein CMP83_10980, partial [Gammaproteobacteria bacterium]|nr:hypothetical protein [Gammaproteobacteria bacterium]
QYNKAKEDLRYETGERFFENLELCIRHDAALNSGAPVFERLWFFWSNHFAITDKDFMPEFATGAYHREILRTRMTGSFTDLVKSATTSWAMIRNLDNSESIGPNSENGRRRRERGKPATVNENHARELMELHTISPEGGYTQDDVIALSYVMAGWETRHTKKRQECNPVRFDQRNHQPGTHNVLGKAYKQRGLDSSNKLMDAIEDLCVHPQCRQFIATKLCRHFICDNPTEAMTAPIVAAWDQTNGHLPSVHKALLQVSWDHTGIEKKFHNPEVWLLQMIKMGGISWPPSPKSMAYSFKNEPRHIQRQPEKTMREIGLSPYRPQQPNGYSDMSSDWLSPELLIRRLAFASESGGRLPKDIDFNALINRNFDNADEVKAFLDPYPTRFGKSEALFPSYWMLMA